jgi:hypothetical protein
MRVNWRSNEAMATAVASARACTLVAVRPFAITADKHQYVRRLRVPGGVSG